jgi:uncharacterized membrane protein (Fun14 family)
MIGQATVIALAIFGVIGISVVIGFIAGYATSRD